MHWYFFNQATGKQWCWEYCNSREKQLELEYVSVLPKRAEKLLVKDYLPPTCPSSIWCLFFPHAEATESPNFSSTEESKGWSAGLFAVTAVADWSVSLSQATSHSHTLTSPSHNNALSALHSSGHSWCCLVTALTSHATAFYTAHLSKTLWFS